jgi:hypothetical protein
MNNELKCIWKKVVVTSFHILLWHLPGGEAEENHKTSVRVAAVP